MKISDMTIRNCVFAFKCNAKWEEMKVVSEDHIRDVEVRFCDSCQKEVYFCSDDDELARNVRLNRCIAIERGDIYSSITLGLPAPHGHFDDDDEDEDDDDYESASDEIKK
jgi:hypothetical protein